MVSSLSGLSYLHCKVCVCPLASLVCRQKHYIDPPQQPIRIVPAWYLHSFWFSWNNRLVDSPHRAFLLCGAHFEIQLRAQEEKILRPTLWEIKTKFHFLIIVCANEKGGNNTSPVYLQSIRTLSCSLDFPRRQRGRTVWTFPSNNHTFTPVGQSGGLFWVVWCLPITQLFTTLIPSTRITPTKVAATLARGIFWAIPSDQRNFPDFKSMRPCVAKFLPYKSLSPFIQNPFLEASKYWLFSYKDASLPPSLSVVWSDLWIGRDSLKVWIDRHS
jgi:hypothetical protein